MARSCGELVARVGRCRGHCVGPGPVEREDPGALTIVTPQRATRVLWILATQSQTGGSRTRSRCHRGHASRRLWTTSLEDAPPPHCVVTRTHVDQMPECCLLYT